MLKYVTIFRAINSFCESVLMHVVQVSNLTAMIARDEYILEESYSGEEEAEEVEEETEGDGDKGELERLRERREVSAEL